MKHKQLPLLFIFFASLSLSSKSQKMEENKHDTNQAKSGQYKALSKQLDTLYESDQRYRFQLISLQNQINSGTPPDKKAEIKDQIAHVAKEMKKQDSINLVLVTGILDQYGWLGIDDVGMNGSQALFLVIQHADLPTQQKYLPMIRTAASEGKTLASNLAILEDRVALREH